MEKVKQDELKAELVRMCTYLHLLREIEMDKHVYDMELMDRLKKIIKHIDKAIKRLDKEGGKYES